MPSRKRPRTSYTACAECNKPAAPWSRFCRPHQRRLRVHGHARAKPVRFTDLLPYIVQARLVLDRNVEHRGLQLALREIEGLLADALRRHAYGERLAPDFQLWLGLAHRGVTALDVLSTFCGAVVYEQLAGDAALNEQAYHHRIARAVLSLDALKARTAGGLPKELAAQGVRALGRLLLEQYAGLAVGIVDAIRTTDQKAHERRALLTIPLR